MIVQFGFFFGGGERRRRRRRPGHLRRDRSSSLAVYVDLVLPHAGAVALPRVRRRPRRRGHHRPAERAGLGAAEDQRRRWSASRRHDLRAARRDERVLHLPGEREELALQPVLDAPAAREAHRGARRAWRRSCSGAAGQLRRWASSTRCSGRRKVKGPAPDRLFAITTAYVDARERSRASRRAARRRSSSSRSRRATSSRSSPTWRRSCAGPATEIGSSVETNDDEFGYRWMIVQRPRPRGPRGRRSTPSATRSRSAATTTACCAPSSPSRTQTKQPIYFIYNYKRGTWYPFVPARGRQAAQHRARAADQGARSAPSCRSSPSSSAGSRCGGSRSEPAGPRPGRRAALRPARAPARARRRPRSCASATSRAWTSSRSAACRCPSSASTATTTTAASSPGSASRASTCGAIEVAGLWFGGFSGSHEYGREPRVHVEPEAGAQAAAQARPRRRAAGPQPAAGRQRRPRRPGARRVGGPARVRRARAPGDAAARPHLPPAPGGALRAPPRYAMCAGTAS